MKETDAPNISSPITGLNHVVLEEMIPSSAIIEKYTAIGDGVSVAAYFKDTDRVSVYRCLDTGYRFYSPFDLTGDDALYQQLERFPWYYKDWKWEYDAASDMVGPNDRVLEIGCGRGAFIRTMRDRGASVVGLEMNSSALTVCAEHGLEVYPHSIQQHALGHADSYDVVCCFQVLEHVADVRSFLESCVAALKPGGRLIVSVPNNDSLIFKFRDNPLNMPPHHMGLWDMQSLIQLQHHFDITLEAMHLEPLQRYHLGSANRASRPQMLARLKQKFGVLSVLLERIAFRFGAWGVAAVAQHIVGHSVLAVYSKDQKSS